MPAPGPAVSARPHPAKRGVDPPRRGKGLTLRLVLLLLVKDVFVLGVANDEAALTALVGDGELVTIFAGRGGDELYAASLIPLRRHLAAPAAEIEPDGAGPLAHL